MKNKTKPIINQSIPNEFSSTLIKYKVEHNPNIHYNYNLAEITAMREERIRENKETQKRQQISECINKCKQNIVKYNQEKQNETNKINESISSVQRGKEYNEYLRKQMKMKAEKKKNKEKEIEIKNYEEEMLPTFSFKEPQEDNDENGNMRNEFDNNNYNNLLESNENANNSGNVVDVSKNILEQIQENKEPTNSHYNSNYYEMNYNQNNYMSPNTQQKNYNLENKDKNIQQQINNNIQMIQKFRKTGALYNNIENEMMNENNYINNDDQNIPQPEPLIQAGKSQNKNDNNFFHTQNYPQQQDININDISSIKSGVNFSTNIHLNTNNSNYFINENIVQPSKYPENYRNKNKINKYRDPYEMNELQQKRYKKALRKLVIDRFNSKKIDIPSICSCGQLQRKIDSLLNENKLITQNDLMNVDCANNCIYYQKPGSYHRALTDIIQSIRTLQLENGIRK